MIRTHLDGPVAHLILDRPDKRNATTPAMLAAIVRAAADLGDAPDVKALLLRGEGDAFCAGFDLTLCRDDDTVLGQLLTGLSTAVRALRRLPVPVVIAAHGAAIAGGCALLGGGDIVVTDAGAKLGYPVVRLGISPAVSAPTLRLLTGDGPARERLLDSALIDGRRALAIGLVHECVDTPAEVLDRSHAIARDLAAKPRSGVAATKRWLNELDGTAADTALDAALAASACLINSGEQRERLAQLWAKR